MNNCNLINKTKIEAVSKILIDCKNEGIARKIKNKRFFSKEDITVFLNINGAALKVEDWNKIFRILE